MRSFLNMENATLELDFNNVDNYQIFLNNNLKDIYDYNFKRVIFHVNEEKLKELYNIIIEKFAHWDGLLMIFTNLTNAVPFDLLDNCIIVNCNNNLIINDKSIYNLIDFDESSVTFIKQKFKENIKIIVNPIIDVKNISKFFKNLNLLFDDLEDVEISLNGYLVSSSLMKEHPCNAYLCDGWKCGKIISCLPKHIYIDSEFNAYPHDLTCEKYIIGNLKNSKLTTVLDKYYMSSNYLNFINSCKKVFIKYLVNYPYDLMPIIEFIKLEDLQHDK